MITPFERIDTARAKKIEYILCDIDDTLTNHGKLSDSAYSALWKLHDHGYKVIPVTGRPAGWCDLIIRQWPVSAIIGENGAFTYYFEDSQLKTLTHPSVAGADVRSRLAKVGEAALEKVPGCRIAKDQFSRIYDVAIDFAEDPPFLGFEAADKIVEVCVAMGCQAKVSSIHVNAWYGDYDKVAMAKICLEQIFHESNPLEKVIFFGDSPNDEPMFEYFPNSCAVANISPFLEKIKNLPAFITREEGGIGFSQAAELLISKRSGE